MSLLDRIWTKLGKSGRGFLRSAGNVIQRAAPLINPALGAAMTALNKGPQPRKDPQAGVPSKWQKREDKAFEAIEKYNEREKRKKARRGKGSKKKGSTSGTSVKPGSPKQSKPTSQSQSVKKKERRGTHVKRKG